MFMLRKMHRLSINFRRRSIKDPFYSGIFTKSENITYTLQIIQHHDGVFQRTSYSHHCSIMENIIKSKGLEYGSYFIKIIGISFYKPEPFRLRKVLLATG